MTIYQTALDIMDKREKAKIEKLARKAAAAKQKINSVEIKLPDSSDEICVFLPQENITPIIQENSTKLSVFAAHDSVAIPIKNNAHLKIKPGSKDDLSIGKPLTTMRERSHSIDYIPRNKMTNSKSLSLQQAGNEGFSKKQYITAQQCYLEAIKLGGHSIALHYNLAVSALKLAVTHLNKEKQLILALNYLQRVHNICPDYQGITLSFIEYFTLKKQYESAFALISSNVMEFESEVAIAAMDGEFYASDLQEKIQQFTKQTRIKQENNLHISVCSLPFVFGWHYEHGINVEQNSNLALGYYALASDAGDPAAEVYLGFCYEFGYLGFEKDLQQALKYYRRAVTKNHPSAFCMLGYLYSEGNGVERDLSMAQYWFDKAAQQNHPEGQYNLGLYLIHGIGIEKNPLQGIRLIEASAAQGFIMACKYMEDDDEYFKNLVELMMNVGRYQTALLQSQDLLMKDCNWSQGEVFSQICSKKIQQRECTGSIPSLMDEYILSSWQANEKQLSNAIAQASYDLGMRYEYGQDIEQNLRFALCHYQKAALKKHVGANARMGFCYETGYLGVAINLELAMEYYQFAAAQNEPMACCALGYLHEAGMMVVQDFSQALRYFQRAASQGNAIGQYETGLYLMHGIGVKKDEFTGRKLIEYAANQGFICISSDLI